MIGAKTVLSGKRYSLVNAGIDQLLAAITPLLYLTAVGVVLSIIYAIVDMFSVDRVLKLVRGSKAFVFLGNEVHYGKLHIPPRSGGGLEVVYTEEGIENPESMIAFMVENYRETGNRKFLEKAEFLTEYFKKRGILREDFDLNSIDIHAWMKPSLVSRKIYPQEAGNITMIISFVDMLTEKEKKARWKKLASIYSPPITKRIYRRVQNSLGYIKDKATSAITAQTTTILKMAPAELQKSLAEAETKIAGSFIAASYDALLENSIGRLVTVKFKDIDGEEKLYFGVLGEYSDKYIYVMDVDYRLQLEALVRQGEITGIRPIVKFYGFRVKLAPPLSITKSQEKISIKNISRKHIRVEKIVSKDKAIDVFRVLRPGEEITIPGDMGEEFKIQLELALESDIVWPRSKATVIGLSDYPPNILKMILER